ncbi:hypothetical protein BGW42_006391, partial [Actinomortierella wolfii]
MRSVKPWLSFPAIETGYQERKAKEKAKKILDAEREQKKAREAARSVTPPAGPDAFHNNKLAGAAAAAANKPDRSGQTLGGSS